VLLDPKVEFGRLCSTLVTAAATKVCGSTFLMLHGGLSGGAFIGHSSSAECKYSMAKSISNSSLKVMIPLGFAKGENSHFGFGFERVLQGSYISRSGHGFVCFDGMAQF
jgi:hypothetical protein